MLVVGLIGVGIWVVVGWLGIASNVQGSHITGTGQTIRVEAASAVAEIVAVSLAPTSLNAGDLLKVSITVRNNSSAPLVTQGPEPGFVYEEGETFYTRGHPDIRGAIRVGIDFDGRTGVDHPYRWVSIITTSCALM